MTDLHGATALSLGFLLGLRHALDADHLAAVSTMVSEQPSLRSSGFIGLCWGFGHTATLLAVGLTVIALRINVPEPVTQWFEVAVGGMLVLLGVSLGWRLWTERWHSHRHEHGGRLHLHFHRHLADPSHGHVHWGQASVKPVLVGMVHGLAGSAALVVLALATVRTAWEGIAYVLVFGLGSIVGMTLLAAVIGLPLALSMSVGRWAGVAVRGLASLASVGLGLAILAQQLPV
jgi:ABC-type nickel/cobalt efflux system permease component RcnA